MVSLAAPRRREGPGMPPGPILPLNVSDDIVVVRDDNKSDNATCSR